MDAWILILAISLSFVAGGAISWAVFHGRLSESKSKIDVLLAQNEMLKAAREDDERHHKESLEAQEARFAQTLAKVTAELKVATEDMLKQRQKEFSQSSAENIGQIVGPLKDTIDRMKQAMNDSTMKQTAMSGEMKAGIENMMKMSEAARTSADELAREPAHGAADDFVQLTFAQDKIAAARQPQIDHDHLDILFGAGELLQKTPRLRRILLLQA